MIERGERETERESEMERERESERERHREREREWKGEDREREKMSPLIPRKISRTAKKAQTTAWPEYNVTQKWVTYM